jgi:hypothetical protein
METACRQSRMWLKKPNPGLLRLPRSKLRILVAPITGHCPLNKHLHNMGLIDEPICIACGMEDEYDIYRNALFSKQILSVEEFEGASALLRLALVSGRFTVTP